LSVGIRSALLVVSEFQHSNISTTGSGRGCDAAGSEKSTSWPSAT